jgi:hypothetical protein
MPEHVHLFLSPVPQVRVRSLGANPGFRNTRAVAPSVFVSRSVAVHADSISTIPISRSASESALSLGSAEILRWESLASERLRCLRMTTDKFVAGKS